MSESARNWKEILLPQYEIRKTKAQKTAFIEMLRGVYGERLRVEEEKKGMKSRNIVLGDPDKAKVICTAHYDTCAVLPFPNFITPKNFLVYLLYQALAGSAVPWMEGCVVAISASSGADVAIPVWTAEAGIEDKFLETLSVLVLVVADKCVVPFHSRQR